MYTFTNANLYQPSLRFADRERPDLTSRRLTMWVLSHQVTTDFMLIIWILNLGRSSKWGWQWNRTGGGWNRGDRFCGRERGGGEEGGLRRWLEETKNPKSYQRTVNVLYNVQPSRMVESHLVRKEVKTIHWTWPVKIKMLRASSTSFQSRSKKCDNAFLKGDESKLLHRVMLQVW